MAASCSSQRDEMSTLRAFIHKVNKVYAESELNDDLMCLERDTKSHMKAHEFKIQGDDMFQGKKYAKSIEYYTRSISYGKEGSNVMGLAYAGRATSLFAAGYYREALLDIARASDFSLPTETQKRLERKRVSAEKKKDLQSVYDAAAPIIPPEDKSKIIKSASSAVEIKDDPVYGRGVYATRDITVGDVIVVEQPFVTVLLQKQEMFYCSECLNPCLALIPCTGCTQMMFCGKECRKLANKKYHKYECTVLKTVKDNLTKHARIALKLLLKNKRILEDVNFYKGGNTYCSDRFWEILNLITNNHKRPEQNATLYAYEAAIIFDLMSKYSDLFREFPGVQSKEVFKGLIMKLAEISAINFHSLYNVFAEEGENEFVIGAGGYAFLSLLNHSCAPNVFRINVGRAMILRANADIRKGEQLFDDYGFHYSKDLKQTRQTELKDQYFFVCNCEACRNNWPAIPGLKCCDKTSHRKMLDISDGIFKNKDNMDKIKRELAKAMDLPRATWTRPSCEGFMLEDILVQGFLRIMQKRIYLK